MRKLYFSWVGTALDESVLSLVRQMPALSKPGTTCSGKAGYVQTFYFHHRGAVISPRVLPD